MSAQFESGYDNFVTPNFNNLMVPLPINQVIEEGGSNVSRIIDLHINNFILDDSSLNMVVPKEPHITKMQAPGNFDGSIGDSSNNNLLG